MRVEIVPTTAPVADQEMQKGRGAGAENGPFLAFSDQMAQLENKPAQEPPGSPHAESAEKGQGVRGSISPDHARSRAAASHDRHRVGLPESDADPDGAASNAAEAAGPAKPGIDSGTVPQEDSPAGTPEAPAEGGGMLVDTAGRDFQAPAPAADCAGAAGTPPHAGGNTSAAGRDAPVGEAAEPGRQPNGEVCAVLRGDPDLPGLEPGKGVPADPPFGGEPGAAAQPQLRKAVSASLAVPAAPARGSARPSATGREQGTEEDACKEPGSGGTAAPGSPETEAPAGEFRLRTQVNAVRITYATPGPREAPPREGRPDTRMPGPANEGFEPSTGAGDSASTAVSRQPAPQPAAAPESGQHAFAGGAAPEESGTASGSPQRQAREAGERSAVTIDDSGDPTAGSVPAALNNGSGIAHAIQARAVGTILPASHYAGRSGEPSASSNSTPFPGGLNQALSSSGLKSMAALLGPRPSGPPQLPDFVAQLAERIQMHIREGDGVLRIQLRPSSLGRIEVKAETSGGRLVATILTETASVREYLENNLHTLRQNFLDQGLKVDRINVELHDGYWNQHPSSGQQESRAGSGQQDGNATASWRGTGDENAGEELALDPATLAALRPHSTFHTVA